NALTHLVDYLERLELERQRDIYVVASSEILNSNILQNACRFGPRQKQFCERILATNDVDKRDGFPGQFLHADLVVVATPTQYHLRAEDQRIVGVLAREIIDGRGIGASFQRLPDEFKLDNGVITSVYVKVRSFEKSDLDALAAEFGRYYPEERQLFKTEIE